MKKLLLLIAIFFTLGINAHAQGGLRLGFSGGAPLSDAEDIYSFDLAADLSYRVDILRLLDIGATAGYLRYFGDEETIAGIDYEVDDVGFIPVAASARIRIIHLFLAGLDLGYGIGLDSDIGGGLYYRPHVGLRLGLFNIIASYSNINVDGGDYGSANLGIEFGI